MSLCVCSVPDARQAFREARHECDRCHGFVCGYAGPGRKTCGSICDCFIDTYPDDPMGLHPEAFVVGLIQQGDQS